MERIDKGSMKQVTISEFKAQCNSILRRVSQTKQAICVTRFGKPVADIVPPAKLHPAGKAQVDRNAWIGSGKGTAKILADIVSPAATKNRSLFGLKPSS